MAALAILALGMVAVSGYAPLRASEVGSPALEMHIRRGVSDLGISGQVSSAGHESILIDIIERQDSLESASIDLSEAELSPPGWALLTELALQATLLTRFSETSIDETGVAVRGVTNDPGAWNVAIARLQAALLPGMRLDNRVLEFPAGPSHTSLCRDQFAAAMKKGPLRFAPGQTAIEAGAQPLLDSLNETAADCASWQIAVRVHGDRSPRDDGNLDIERAQSIVDYLTGHGLAAQRIAIAKDVAAASGRPGEAVFLFSPMEPGGEPARDDPGVGVALPTAAPQAN